jgi:hypothetical protein
VSLLEENGKRIGPENPEIKENREHAEKCLLT